MAATGSLSIQAETPYAIINVAGAKQYVEEGMSFYTPASVFDDALKGTVQFRSVLALKSDGTLIKGTRSNPYVNALVEGELQEEVRVRETNLKKVKVTKITRTSSV
jgi:ribosomal protein L21